MGTPPSAGLASTAERMAIEAVRTALYANPTPPGPSGKGAPPEDVAVLDVQLLRFVREHGTNAKKIGKRFRKAVDWKGKKLPLMPSQDAAIAATWVAVAGTVGSPLEAFTELVISPAFARHIGLAEIFDVLHTQIVRIAPQRTGDDVDLRFGCPGRLCAAETAIGPGRGRVGQDAIAIDVQVVPVIGAGQPVAGFLRHERARVGIGAGVEPDTPGPGDKRAIGHHPRFDVKNCGMLTLR